jgi:hypothetical protein
LVSAAAPGIGTTILHSCPPQPHRRRKILNVLLKVLAKNLKQLTLGVFFFLYLQLCSYGIEVPTNYFTNGDFESGNLNGWNTFGDAFQDKRITSDDDGGRLNADGNYHLKGNHIDWATPTGTMTSGKFTIVGDGQISFKIGGSYYPDDVMFQLIRTSDLQVLFTAHGADVPYPQNEELVLRNWDASTYVGEEVFFHAMDNASGTGAFLSLDSVTIPVDLNYQYPIQVNGDDGTGTGNYKPGTQITLTANMPTGEKFIRWTATAGTFSDPDSPTTTYTVSTSAAEISAHTTNFTTVDTGLHRGIILGQMDHPESVEPEMLDDGGYPAHLDHNYLNETFDIFVPDSYPNRQQPYGLMAHASSGDFPGAPYNDWMEVLEEKNIIWVSGLEIGNSVWVGKRKGKTILALKRMMELYDIDPERVYVSGFSGGSLVAGSVAFCNPSWIKALISNGRAFAPTISNLPYGNRYVYSSHYDDHHNAEIMGSFYSAFNEGYTCKWLNRSGGHEVIREDDYALALDFIEHAMTEVIRHDYSNNAIDVGTPIQDLSEPGASVIQGASALIMSPTTTSVASGKYSDGFYWNNKGGGIIRLKYHTEAAAPSGTAGYNQKTTAGIWIEGAPFFSESIQPNTFNPGSSTAQGKAGFIIEVSQGAGSSHFTLKMLNPTKSPQVQILVEADFEEWIEDPSSLEVMVELRDDGMELTMNKALSLTGLVENYSTVMEDHTWGIRLRWNDIATNYWSDTAWPDISKAYITLSTEALDPGQAVGKVNVENVLVVDNHCTLTVVDGGNVAEERYVSGESISVNATPPPGYRFLEWVSSNGVPPEVNGANTTYTMPNENVTLTAIYAFDGPTRESFITEFFDGNQSDPNAADGEDPDGDGFTNLMERAFGFNPTIHSGAEAHGVIPRGVIRKDEQPRPQPERLELILAIPDPTMPDLIYKIYAADSLHELTSNPAEIARKTGNGDWTGSSVTGGHLVEITDPPRGDGRREFCVGDPQGMSSDTRFMNLEIGAAP